MRHPIDDIFKDGLSHQEHALKQADWLKAKDMLDLEKRKRRLPIWWFGLAASLLLGAILIPIFYMGQEGVNNVSEIVNIDLNQDSQDISVENTPDSITNNDKTDLKRNSLKINNIGNVAATDIEVLAETIISKKIADQVVPAENSQYTTSNLPNSKANLNEHSVVEMEMTMADLGVSKEKTSISENKNSLAFPESIDNQSNAFSSSSLIEENEKRKQSPAIISITFLTPTINKLKTLIDLPIIEDYVLNRASNVKKSRYPWSWNLYTAYTIPNDKPSLGLLLNRDISSRWSTSIGIGVNYLRRKNLEFSGELEIVDASGFRQLSDVSETLSFEQVSLEIPVNIGYRIRRHSIMAVAIAEINLWSELTQNSTISNADALNMDPASPSMSINDPITLMQNAKTINEASLSMPNYYVGIGYGVDVNPKISFQINGLRNLSAASNESVSNSLTSSQVDLLNESNWLLRTSLILRF